MNEGGLHPDLIPLVILRDRADEKSATSCDKVSSSAKAGATTEELRKTFVSLGFSKISITDDGQQWGLAFAAR